MGRVAGFDIGGTSARLRVYDEDWGVVAGVRRGTRDLLTPEALVEALGEMLAEAGAKEGLRAVGVGLAAQLDAAGERVLNAPNFGWVDVPFAKILRESLQGGSPEPPCTVLVNDLSAILWGEHQAGAARGQEEVLAVYVGTGVGGAILSGGGLVEGAGGTAGEIGHVKVAPGGRLCGCGERGCLEAYVGGVHLERQVERMARAEGMEELFRADGRVDLASADELAGGREAIDRLWGMASDYLAVSVANAVTLLNPGMLLLGGGILENLPNLTGRLLAKLPPLISESARADLAVEFSELGDEAGALGAAMLAARRVVSV